jgi:glucokinase
VINSIDLIFRSTTQLRKCQMMFYAITLDIGGSSVKSGIVTPDGQIIGDTLTTPIDSSASADTILDAFAAIISQHIEHHGLADLAGVALGFPGPFDYEVGISQITGQEKYETLYDVNVKAGLISRLNLGSRPLRFRNDAEAAIMGECRYGAGKGYSRIIGVTLGTGLGSAFVADGLPQLSGKNIPQNGWLYAELWRGQRADDVFSIRGLQARLGSDDLKQAADMARNGDETIRRVFQQFGSYLGDFLLPYAQSFQADIVLALGGIAGAFDLFGSTFETALSIPVKPGTRGADAALLGAADLIFSQAE